MAAELLVRSPEETLHDARRLQEAEGTSFLGGYELALRYLRINIECQLDTLAPCVGAGTSDVIEARHVFKKRGQNTFDPVCTYIISDAFPSNVWPTTCNDAELCK
jgi:hypothetical protein